MKCCAAFLVVSALALAATAEQPQVKYTIKLKEPGPGESWRVDVKETTKSKYTTPAEKENQPKTEESTAFTHVVFTETIIERPAGAKVPTKAKRVYETAVKKGTATSEKNQMLPYHGKTLFIEKTATLFDLRLEGAGLLGQDNIELNMDLIGEGPTKRKVALVPPAAVAVGEEWHLNFSQFLVLDDPVVVGAMKSKSKQAPSKLVNVYQKEGRLYGKVESFIALEGAWGKSSPLKGQVDRGSSSALAKYSAKVEFDGCIDGTFAEGRMIVQVDITLQGRYTPFKGKTQNTDTSTIVRTIDLTWKQLPKK